MRGAKIDLVEFISTFVANQRVFEFAVAILLSKEKPNMIAQAHHGSGKTATYSLGMLGRVDPSVNEPQCICVCPARELALQVASVVEKLAKYTGIKVFAAVKGSERGKVQAHIVVGTVGSIKGKFKYKEVRLVAAHIQSCVLLSWIC